MVTATHYRAEPHCRGQGVEPDCSCPHPTQGQVHARRARTGFRWASTSWRASASRPAVGFRACRRRAPDALNLFVYDVFCAAVLRIVRARSTGSTVLRTAAQRMPCVGASLISSHNPSAACPSGCPGSVGHSYALLRQQAKNNRGRREAGRSPRAAPPTWKEHNHERKEVP